MRAGGRGGGVGVPKGPTLTDFQTSMRQQNGAIIIDAHLGNNGLGCTVKPAKESISEQSHTLCHRQNPYIALKQVVSALHRKAVVVGPRAHIDI